MLRIHETISGHSPPHSQVPILANKGYFSHNNNTVVIRKPSGPLTEIPPHREDKCTEFLLGTPTNYQKMAQLGANIQRLIESIVEVVPHKVNWCKVELCTQKEEHPKTFVECFIQAFFKKAYCPNP